MAKKTLPPQIISQLDAGLVQIASTLADAPEVTLYAPLDADLNRLATLIANSYTVPAINELLNPLLSFYRGVRIRELNQDGTPCRSPYFEGFLRQKRFVKQDFSKALAFLLQDPRNLRPYIDHLPKPEVLLTQLLFERLYVSALTLQQMMSETQWYVEHKEFSWRSSLEPTISLPWAGMVCAQRWGTTGDPANYYYYLSGELLTFFARALRPDVQPFPTGWDELPTSDEPLTVFDGESQMVASYDILLSQHAQESLTVDRNLKMYVADVRRTQQLTGIRHFHPEDLPKGEALANSFTLSLPIVARGLQVFSEIQVQDFLRQIVDRLPAFYDDYTFFSVLLPYVSGFKRRIVEGFYRRSFSMRLLGLLRACGSQWLSFQQIYLSMLCYHEQHEGYHMAPLPLQLMDEMDLVNKLTGRKLLGKDVKQQITMGLLKALCCTLAGMGVLQVACRPYRRDGSEVTPYDFMQYVRLTSLGRYVLRVTDTYSPPRHEHREFFALDDQHLILRSLSDDNPYLPLLSETAEYIGAHRYRMSPDSFLNSCSNETDVNNRIQQFRQFICAEPPKIWEDFFAEIRRHVHPLSPLDAGDYRLYTIDSHNQPLIDLLTSDVELRRLVIRAEGFRILVSRSNHRKFVARLKTFGYLL